MILDKSMLVAGSIKHVVRLINHHFLTLLKLHDKQRRSNHGLISLMRRHEWKLIGTGLTHANFTQ